MTTLVTAQEDKSAFALQWYLRMQEGELDRTQLSDAYSAQLTDHAVEQMSRRLNHYGAPPKSAETLQRRDVGEQKIEEGLR